MADEVTVTSSNLYSKISELIKNARYKTIKAVNQTMVHTYFNIGRIIIEDEQQGKERADYGKQVLIKLSDRLKDEFGKGFSVQNLENMRKFYLLYSSSEKSQSSIRIFEKNESSLSWTHYHDRYVKLPDENKTIGIILCKDKNQSLVEITLPEDNDQIFASRYKTVLPDKKTFIELLNQSGHETDGLLAEVIK